MRSPVAIVRNFFSQGTGEAVAVVHGLAIVTAAAVIACTVAVGELDVSAYTRSNLESLAFILPLGGMMFFWLKVLRAI